MTELPRNVLTLGEVARYLRVSQYTIYRLLRDGKLPGFRLGKDWRFNLESIERWLADSEQMKHES